MIKNRIIYDVNTGVVLDIIVPQILIVGQDNFVEFSLEFMDGLNKVTNINWQVVTIFERPDGEKSNKLLATLTGDAYIKKIPSWATDIEGILKITTQIIVGGVVRPLGIALIPVEEGLEPANDTITEAQYQLLTSELNGLNNKIETHQNRIDNPHQVTKAQVGLENVDPTSDIDKPVSTAQKTYIDTQDNALGGRIDDLETDNTQNKANILALETANMFKDVTYNGASGVLQFTLFDDTTKSIDLSLELLVESGYIKYNNGDSTLVAVNVKTAIDELDSKKMDKNFSALPPQANPLLTDVLVLNRGTTVQKTTLGDLLAQFDNEIFEVVGVLPTTGVANKIYLVPSSDPETQNALDEFIWVDNDWEKIGAVSVDLSNYFNKTEINSILDDKVDKNANITAGTHPKITYDSKGLVTAGADLVEEDIPALSTSKITQTASARFVTDTEKTTWNNKVDKVTGKDLSTNDYTTTEKNKLSGIEAGAEVNVQSDWTQEVNTADDYIKNKPAIPTKVSDLTNDTGYITGYTETDPIFTAWNKSTGISITKSQVSDLIEATQSLPGLMSATDKQRLDVLHALLEEDTENNVVDSINEVLAIFNNYPEGADLVSALAGKVNKADIVDNVTTNDATKVLSAKQGKVLNDTVALKVNTSDIVDNLTSTDTNKPLSANQGKVLKDLVDATVGNIDAILDSILGV